MMRVIRTKEGLGLAKQYECYDKLATRITVNGNRLGFYIHLIEIRCKKHNLIDNMTLFDYRGVFLQTVVRSLQILKF